MKSIRTSVIAAVAAVGLVSVVSPANAAPPALPAGDQLISVSCSAFTWASLLSVDSATGATSITETDSDYFCGYQGAWDSTTETYFGIDGSDSTSRLVTIDTETSATTVVGPVVDSVTSDGLFVDALTIGTDGAAYFVSSGEFYSVDLGTAVATDLGPLAGVTDDAWGFSVDPSTGAFYLLEEDGDLYSVDPVAVTATYLASWTLTDGATYTYGLAIDHAGTAWVVTWDVDRVPSLWSTSLAAFGDTEQLSGRMVRADDFHWENWWVAVVPAPVPAPAPALADTGSSVNAPLVGGAVLLMLAGAALVALRRRRVA